MMNFNDKIQSEIDTAIENHDEIVFITYSIFDEINEPIKYILEKTVSSAMGTSSIVSSLFSSIKEITTNAIKANIKSLIIQQGKVKNISDDKEIVSELRKALTEDELRSYGKICKDKHLFITIHFNFSENDFLKIKVVNPVPLSKPILERINNKLSKAREYDSLAHFYLENPDPMAEGMGLGLSMIVVLLKGINIDPDNFIIETCETQTSATLKIPLELTSVD